MNSKTGNADRYGGGGSPPQTYLGDWALFLEENPTVPVSRKTRQNEAVHLHWSDQTGKNIQFNQFLWNEPSSGPTNGAPAAVCGVKLTDPPPAGSSRAPKPPLQDCESSHWEWGSSQSELVPSLRPWGNGSGFRLRGTRGFQYLRETKGKKFQLDKKRRNHSDCLKSLGKKTPTKSGWFYVGKANKSM